MASEATANENAKLCFVTTGATAPFTALIESVMKPASLDALLDSGYTYLFVQYGAAKDVFNISAEAAQIHLKQVQHDKKLIIDGMDFDSSGLVEHFKLVQETRGLVISHAGSGSILEALRFQVPLIVVPNTALLDNHQEELAVAMEKFKYVLRGDVNNLAPAIQGSDNFRQKMAQFPPVTGGEQRHTKNFANVMDETTGLTDMNME